MDEGVPVWAHVGKTVSVNVSKLGSACAPSMRNHVGVCTLIFPIKKMTKSKFKNKNAYLPRLLRHAS